MFINYCTVLLMGAAMLLTTYSFIIAASSTGPNCPDIPDKTYLGFCENYNKGTNYQ